MSDFQKIFQDAMELCCLGLYEKSENRSEQGVYRSSPLLKKALDKFSLLNITYSLFTRNGEPILPTDETALIKTFNFPVKYLIDRLPNDYKQLLICTEWYTDEEFVNIGNNNYYYCTPELLDKLNERIYYKAKNARYKELELQSQKFIELLFKRHHNEYVEIRDFLQQRKNAYITGRSFIKNENIQEFRNKYPDIFEAAYEKLNFRHAKLKICKHCGLVLKELNDGTLYCVSSRCSQKTKGFTKYEEFEISEESIWVLRLNVARFIYYPGMLEQKIKRILKKEGIEPILWPNKDDWDFAFTTNGENWVIDAKDVKDPRMIQEDIMKREKSDIPYDKVTYIVPSDRNNSYVRAVNRVINNREKIQCMTLASFKKIIKEMQEVRENVETV